MALVLWAISVITFVIFYLIPGGDPALRIAGRNSNETLRAQIREDYGFNDAKPVQYLRLMEKTFNGQLESYSDRTNVRERLLQGVPATASLILGAAAIWLFFGVLLGVISAVYAGRWPDRLLTIFAITGISLPEFWIGLLALYWLTYKVSWFPPGGYAPLTAGPVQWAYHLVLPWATLALLSIGFYSRLLRSNILDTIHDDFVRTAWAKGLSRRRVLGRHVLRNALIPIVTVFGLDVGASLGGAILVEKVFGLNGVGQYIADSVGSLDLPPILGTTLYGAFLIVAFSALVDIAYAFIDPRIRLQA